MKCSSIRLANDLNDANASFKHLNTGTKSLNDLLSHKLASDKTNLDLRVVLQVPRPKIKLCLLNLSPKANYTSKGKSQWPHSSIGKGDMYFVKDDHYLVLEVKCFKLNGVSLLWCVWSCLALL